MTDLDGLRRLNRVWPLAPGDDHASGLIQLASDWIQPYFEIAEVGVFEGVSTRILACFAARVWAVDAWELASAHGYTEIPEHMLTNARIEFYKCLLNYHNIFLINDLSTVAATRFGDGSLDMVYLDGEHGRGGFETDVKAWMRKVKVGGYLAGHDGTALNFEGVGLPVPQITYIDTSWVIPKTPELG